MAGRVRLREQAKGRNPGPRLPGISLEPTGNAGDGVTIRARGTQWFVFPSAEPAAMPRYLEDMQSGDIYESPAFTLTEADSLRFAHEFDPQPFHLDRTAAQASAFGDLAASGWHTAALTMRGIVASGMDPGWGYLGAGVEEMRWPRPTFPGDALHVRIQVLEIKPSRSKPDRGIVRMQVDTLRADDQPVQQMIVNMLVPARPVPV